MPRGYKLALFSRKGGIIYHEVHGYGRLRYLLEGNGFRRIIVTDGITDLQIRYSGNRNYIAASRYITVYLF